MIKMPMGTALTVELMENLNSHRNQIGDDVWFRTTEDVRVDGSLVVKAGTPVKALVRNTEETSSFPRPGSLDVTIVSSAAADGTVFPLVGQVSAIGPLYISNAKTALGVPAILLFGIAGTAIVGALTKGAVSFVPSGKLFSAFAKRDTWIKPVQTTGETNSVTGNTVLKAHAPGEIVFNVHNGEVSEAVHIVFESSLDIASAELFNQHRKTSFPIGPEVSIAWVTDTKSMPRAWNCSRANTSSRIDLGKRSNFQTATTSKRRFCASRIIRSSSARTDRDETP